MRLKQDPQIKLERGLDLLHEELEASIISHAAREEVLTKIEACREQLKAVVAGRSSIDKLEQAVHQLDIYFAEACLQQAKQEIPKREVGATSAQALEHVSSQLASGHLSPHKVRQEVKRIRRHQIR